jgi:hypothetical protein
LLWLLLLHGVLVRQTASGAHLEDLVGVYAHTDDRPRDDRVTRKTVEVIRMRMTMRIRITRLVG